MKTDAVEITVFMAHHSRQFCHQ